MSWHISRRHPSECRFSYQQMTPPAQRKHFWGLPNKNYGFLTSDQLEQLSRKVKTEPEEDVYFREKVKRQPSRREVKFEDEDNNHGHYCTCHSNPHRYHSYSQRCKYCQQHKIIPKNHSRHSRHSLGRDTFIYNPEQSTPTYELVSDKAVQVDIKLPKIKHNNRNSEYCQACQIKKKCKQHRQVSSELIVNQLKKARVKGFSFGNSSKAVNYQPVKVHFRRDQDDF